jgi:hypothetical protein
MAVSNKPAVEEQLEVLRRIAERGKAHTEPAGADWGDSTSLDLFIHMLDEIERTKALLT